jgi:hypothetical protein
LKGVNRLSHQRGLHGSEEKKNGKSQYQLSLRTKVVKLFGPVMYDSPQQ